MGQVEVESSAHASKELLVADAIPGAFQVKTDCLMKRVSVIQFLQHTQDRPGGDSAFRGSKSLKNSRHPSYVVGPNSYIN